MLSPKKPTPRRFDYTPRFYDPTEDDRFKRRLRFTSATRRGRRPAFLVLVIILALVLLIIISI